MSPKLLQIMKTLLFLVRFELICHLKVGQYSHSTIWQLNIFYQISLHHHIFCERRPSAKPRELLFLFTLFASLALFLFITNHLSTNSWSSLETPIDSNNGSNHDYKWKTIFSLYWSVWREFRAQTRLVRS